MTSPLFQARNGRLLRLLALFILLSLLTFLFLQAGPLAAQEPVLPPGPPDAEIGIELFQERCANCHGPAGQGDGELSADLPRPPADYTDPEFRRTRIPAGMYSAITNGLLESGMPPLARRAAIPSMKKTAGVSSPPFTAWRRRRKRWPPGKPFMKKTASPATGKRGWVTARKRAKRQPHCPI
ncbi:MAG: c-type cytochrome [Chloroflexi bacterium]|nr:c-type cytochrome [Chloroflexota bacterium]